MSGKSQPRAALTQYLLGLVSPSERERLESEYFTNDDAFAEMLSAEDDLIDAYARGQLSAKERHQFEQRFLKSESGRERVQFARTLAGYVADTQSSEKPSPYQPGFFASLQSSGMALRYAVVAFLVLGLATTWLLIQQGRMRNELQALRAERDTLNQKTEQLQRVADAERTRNAESTSQIEKLQQELAQKAEPQKGSGETTQRAPRDGSQPGNTDQKYAANRKTERSQQVTPSMGNTISQRTITQLPGSSTFDLTPGTVRSEGGTTNTFTIPKNAKSIVLRLGLENAGYEYYRAVIETAEGTTVRSFDRFKSVGPTRTYHSVQLPLIPARELPVGVYVIALHAQQPDGSFLKVGDYQFTVKRSE